MYEFKCIWYTIKIITKLFKSRFLYTKLFITTPLYLYCCGRRDNICSISTDKCLRPLNKICKENYYNI